MLRLDVARLKRSPGDTGHFEIKADLPLLEMPGERIAFAGPVVASLDVANTGRSLRVEGEVSGRLELTCGRCLEPFEHSFEVPLEETYVQNPEGGGEEAVLFSGDSLDVTPEAMKSIILSLPMKAVCREECPGLCPTCGRSPGEGPCDCSSEKIDPRLSVLQDFFKGKS